MGYFLLYTFNIVNGLAISRKFVQMVPLMEGETSKKCLKFKFTLQFYIHHETSNNNDNNNNNNSNL